MDTTDEPPHPRPPKKLRSRLAISCNRCRQKKIKCDERQPACTPCVAAGNLLCETSKPSEKSSLAPVRRKTGIKLAEDRESSPRSINGAPQASSDSASVSPSSTYNAPMASTSTSSSLAHLLHAAEIPTSSSHAGYGLFGQNGKARPIATPAARPPPPPPAPPPAQSLHKAKIDRFAESGFTHSVDQRRRFVGASSSQALLRWLDNASSGTQLSDHLKHGLATSDEWLFAGLDDPEDHLPDNTALHRYADMFFVSTFPIFPFLEEGEIRSLINNPRSSLNAVTKALLYALIAHSADSECEPGTLSPVGTKFLQLAWKALPSIASRPYRVSVQALIMLSLALRTREREGLAWTVGSLAIRIALSFGMHLARGNGSDPGRALEARIWYTAWCIDKVETLEAGRQSSVDDRGCSIRPSALGNSTTMMIPGYPDPVDVFTPYVTLCYEVESIFSWLFSSATELKSKEDVLRKIGERDASLTKWLTTVPSALRPSSEPPAADQLLPWTAMLHLLYHNTLITLHRISLFDHATHIVPLLSQPALRPYAPRLQNSVSICLSSARSTLACLERLSSALPTGKLWTFQPIFTAIVVIAVHTYQNPSTWQASADLGLLKHSTAFARDVLRRAGYSDSYTDMLNNLYKKTKSKVDRPLQPSRPPSRSGREGVAAEAHNSNESPTAVAGSSSSSSVTPNAQVPSMLPLPSAHDLSANVDGAAADDALSHFLGFGQAVGWDGQLVQPSLDTMFPFLLGNGGSFQHSDLFFMPAGSADHIAGPDHVGGDGLGPGHNQQQHDGFMHDITDLSRLF
ncbi:hypothetical protein OIO90_001759 [Microbotryomycetes sp. JL221]|nr:hypothetical protein OIO90_001759 [Microbotryomycetes sp. JL221]